MNIKPRASLLRLWLSGVTHVRISTAFDDCVCEKCRKYEGKKYPTLLAPVLPLCDHCRCAYEYIFKE